MSFLVLMGFLFTLIIGVKLTLLLINLLQSNYGRKMGFGVKWTSDKNEYVLIAGATGLVGREFVREFASMGFNLILVSKNKDKLTALEQDYKEKYHLKEVKLVHTDFGRPESVDTVRNSLTDVSTVAALVNCMDLSFAPSKFTEYPSGFNSDLLNINVVAPVLLIEMVLPKMVQQKRGVIINYSSQCGRFQFPYFSTFSATKAFISTLSEVLSVEYASEGITVQNVEPLFVQSYMSHFKENFLLVPPAQSVCCAMLEVGMEPTTFGHWKHKMTAVVLNTMLFLLGSRLTSKIVGCTLSQFVVNSAEKQVTDSTTSNKLEEDKKASDSKSEDSSKASQIDSSASSSEASKMLSTSVSSDQANKEVKINIEKSKPNQSVKPEANNLTSTKLENKAVAPGLLPLPGAFPKATKEKSNSMGGPVGFIKTKPFGSAEPGKGSLFTGSSVNGATSLASSMGSSIGSVDSHASSTPSSVVEDSKTKK